MRPLGGSIPALATPFRAGRIDGDALARLTERQVAAGSIALVVCGSTGEASAMTPQEQARAIAIVVEAAARRVPVIAGCSAACTQSAVALGVAAARQGADALLCAAPAYVKPTQAGIEAHLAEVALAADLPLIVYDVPGRTGVAIADETIAALFARGLACAVKDATADLSRPPRLRALCGAGLRQLTGDDATAVAHRAMGGHGCISVTANVTPALCAMLHAAWQRGDLPTVAALRDLLAPLHAVLFAEGNPIPLKAALFWLDLCGGELRLPLTDATPQTRRRLVAVLRAVMPAETRATAPKLRLALAG